MRKVFRPVIAALLFVGILAIPLPERNPPEQEPAIPFVWNQDDVWNHLEQKFLSTKDRGCQRANLALTEDFRMLRSAIRDAEEGALSPESQEWDGIESAFFEAAAMVAACPESAQELSKLVSELRRVVKQQSRDWDLLTVTARSRLYRLLYGSRTAVEEVMIQGADSSLSLQVESVPASASPSAVIRGVRIYSGDMLVSRGGYPTSALISRGSDYPGNFSHVALAHVSEAGEVSVIEAHIEVGVTISPVEKYLEDKKLRLMVLRLRNDLPAVIEDPLLPHKAATYSFDGASSGHIPYDFAMNYQDPSKLFCSEVASDAYDQVGITLWTGISTISADGLRRWLAAFGVRYFETQEPSDLEYDPQLEVVAEWRDHKTLIQDRVDNAVVDAMLEKAEAGIELGYPWWQLPAGRLAKGYSYAKNLIGSPGPVPEGMSAPSALRNKYYTEWHDRVAELVSEDVDSFAFQNGYQPPYWRILDMARSRVAVSEQ